MFFGVANFRFFKNIKAFISYDIFIEIMVNGGFTGLAIACLTGVVLIAVGVAIMRFWKEWISDTINVETILLFSTALIIVGIVIPVIFFVLLFLDRYR